MTDQSPAYHFQVIARALGVIDEAGPALTLEDLAAKMQMSPAHFQRVFSSGSGVSPKRYQQYLTLGHARRLLAERHTMLGTALATGLSGTGRLHDLFLTWEAMSPGRLRAGRGRVWRSAGAGSKARSARPWSWRPTRASAASGSPTRWAPRRRLKTWSGRWPKAAYIEDPMALRPMVDAAFGGRATDCT